MAVNLREVTAHNVDAVLALEVAPEQRSFVASNAKTIAQAHYFPGVAWFRAIYRDDVPVGLVAFILEPGQDAFLWRLMIGAPYQRRGYGTAAVELAIREIVHRRPATRVLRASHVPGHGSPGPFFERLGFAYTGAVENGEVQMRRDATGP